MDRKAFDRLRRGKLKPEARLDLHGMTLDQARPALTRFLMSSHAQGRRLVLVITGKGKSADDAGPIPARRGLLRHNVPAWLQQPPLAQIVLQVTQAHLRHGGSGALYVYLRRHR
jgi:DNA-nicking Smr family endonuclease